MANALPGDFWQHEHEWLARILLPRLQGLATAGVMDAEKKLNRLGIFFDNSLTHARAASWARQHTDSILQQFQSRTSDMVGPKIEAWMSTPGQTMGDLVDLLKPILDENATRAWAMAVTETTRAYAEGNDLTYQAAGIPRAVFKPPLHVNCRCDIGVYRIRSKNQWVVVWLTERDGVVCKTPHQTPWGLVQGCAAMHKVVISEGEYLGRKFEDL